MWQKFLRPRILYLCYLFFGIGPRPIRDVHYDFNVARDFKVVKNIDFSLKSSVVMKNSTQPIRLTGLPSALILVFQNIRHFEFSNPLSQV